MDFKSETLQFIQFCMDLGDAFDFEYQASW